MCRPMSAVFATGWKMLAARARCRSRPPSGAGMLRRVAQAGPALERSTAQRMSASSMGRMMSAVARFMPRFLPRAWAIAAPRQRPTSSTLWCASTSRSPLQLTARSKPPWQAQERQHVVEEADAGMHLGAAGTVELKAQLHGGLRGLAAHFTVVRTPAPFQYLVRGREQRVHLLRRAYRYAHPVGERAAQVADEDAALPERLHILPRADKAGARQDEVRARIRQLEAALHELRSQAAALKGYAGGSWPRSRPSHGWPPRPRDRAVRFTL